MKNKNYVKVSHEEELKNIHSSRPIQPPATAGQVGTLPQCPDAPQVAKTTIVDDSTNTSSSWTRIMERVPPLKKEFHDSCNKKYIFRFADKEQFIVGSARLTSFRNDSIIFYYVDEYGSRVSKIYKITDFSHWMELPDIP